MWTVLVARLNEYTYNLFVGNKTRYTGIPWQVQNCGIQGEGTLTNMQYMPTTSRIAACS